MSAPILVTGAAGFIGMHVARALLARGEHVIGVDNLNEYYAVSLKEDRLAAIEAEADGRFTMLRLDFADSAALTQKLAPFAFDRIVHLGAQAGVRHSIENPHAYAQSNLVGHLNLLEVARHRAVRHMVYASSSSVYGATAALPFDVASRADHPLSLYAATKRADELMSEAYAHLYRLPLTGLRFFTVYGPWGRPDMAVWLFTDAVLAGRPIQVFNRGDMRRDFTYVDDIVAGVLGCLDRPPPDDGAPKAGASLAPHRLYNIGNHRSERLDDLVMLIEQACGRAAERIDLPMQAGDMKDTFADITAITDDIGFTPVTALAQGVPRFVAWFRDYTGR